MDRALAEVLANRERVSSDSDDGNSALLSDALATANFSSFEPSPVSTVFSSGTRTRANSADSAPNNSNTAADSAPQTNSSSTDAIRNPPNYIFPFGGVVRGEPAGLLGNAFPADHNPNINLPLHSQQAAFIASKNFTQGGRVMIDAESSHIMQHLNSGDVDGDVHMRGITSHRLRHLACLNTATIAAILQCRAGHLREDIQSLASCFVNALSNINTMDNLSVHSIATLEMQEKFDKVITEVRDFMLTASSLTTLAILKERESSQ